jgi:predicted ATPase
LESRILDEPVLVGRERELEQLQRYLNLAIEGKGTTVFIFGEAGAGKTRLLTEFLKIGKKKRVTILTGWCLSDAAVPYFPFVEAFDSYSSADEDETATINQKIGLKSSLMENNQSKANQKLAISKPQVWKDQAFAAVIKELLFLSANKTVILALEDIHWADSASLSLLQYLARQVSSERILIVGTFRSEELKANREDHPNPLSSVLLLMGREDLYREVKLPNLGASDVDRIAESMLGGNVNPKLIERIAIESGGNPLFVVETIRMLHQQGNLSKKNGQWCLCIDEFEIPSKVKDVILRRLEALTANQRKILDVASVVGEKFDPDLVADVVSQESTDVLRELNQIAKSTLMVNCDGNFYRFIHAKFREMLYKEMPLLLRRKYHLKIAEKMESVGQPIRKLPVTDLFYHYVESGNKAKGTHYSLEAGKAALSQSSNEEAIKYFKHAIEATEASSELIQERRVALEGLGDAFYSNSMFEESMKVFEELSECTDSNAVKLRALRKAMESAFQNGDATHLMDFAKKVEPYVAADRLESARVLISKGRAFLIQGKHRENLEAYKAALEVFEEEYSLWDAALALLGIGVAQGILENSPDATTSVLRSIALFEDLGDYRMQMEACFAAGVTFNMCFLEHEALKLLAKIVEIDNRTKMGDYNRLSRAYVNSSMSYELMGEFEMALSSSLKALELSEKTDSLWTHGQVYSFLTMEFAQSGDLKSAETFFEKLMKLPSEILMHRSMRGVLPKAVLLAAKGRWKESNRYFQESLESLRANGPLAQESVAKLYYAWALEKQGCSEKAKVQLEDRDRMRREAKAKFKNTQLLVELVAPKKVQVSQLFELRLDIVNVSESYVLLVRVENLRDKFKPVLFVQSQDFQNSSINLGKERLEPFQVKTVKISLQANQSGEIVLAPKIVYIDNYGKTASLSVRKACVIIQPAAAERAEEPPQIAFEFKSKDAQKAFDFLIKAFLDDYAHRKLPLEMSGWRTLMDLVRGGKVSRYGAYGSHRHYGRGAILELERRNLVDVRVFSGERGRGGEVMKLRVNFENQSLRGRLVSKS